MSLGPRLFSSLAALTILLAAIPVFGSSAEAAEGCVGGTLAPGRGEDLILSMSCRVTGPQGDGDTNPHKYHYGNINIIKGGSLTFDDARIEFWAKSILIENGGSLIAGTEQAPIGDKGGLTIVLYGDEKQPTGTGKGDGGQGIICRSPTDGNTGPCGIPLEPQWNSQGTRPVELPGTDEHGAPITDYFYRYEPLPYDDGGAQKGYFGYRVLALSYGGTLKLFGKRGATSAALDPMDSGTSWVRLAKSVTKGDDILVLDREVDWKEEDQIVLTTTDYLPGHSEELTVQEVGPDKKTIRVKQSVKFAHNGAVYPLDTLPARLKLDFTTAEIRAAVALLTRSIRIVSGGERFGERFSHDSYIGGHTVVRQGFLAYQVQGVELAQLGQGGRLGHYPIHFHMARKAPSGTFVRDSSINESMTRWITLHATHNVTLQRNVGWKSIGHGFYLEDGTEINNNLYSNIGIFARAAVYDADGAKINPRKVPGILASPDDILNPITKMEILGGENVPFHSDYDHPTVFWIMNGWNGFVGNMAAGAGTCGACYWLVPGANSAHSRHQTWTSYASMQAPLVDSRTIPPTPLGNALARAATTPLKLFRGNYCTSAANSFNTVDNTSACLGVNKADRNTGFVHLQAVPNPLAPKSCLQHNPVQDEPNEHKYVAEACALHPDADSYYPKVGGLRKPTLCSGEDTDCSKAIICNSDPEANFDKPVAEANCTVTAIDRYTSSFNFTETNFGAIWLRPQWYLMINSVLTDIQNGGVTFVTGGGYTASDVIHGHWALARKNVFIGQTQPVPGQPPPSEANPYVSAAGPVNPKGLTCDKNADGSPTGNYCLVAEEGISYPLSSFGLNQRFFNIYDGPAYQEANAYLNIKQTPITDCSPADSPRICFDSRFMYGRVVGMPQDDHGVCYLPNAAIAWKQPNGFYYPPAFHSRNLYFDQDVDIRHFVIEPLFKPGTFQTNDTCRQGDGDAACVKNRYCTWVPTMFDNFTDIDRQTELNDDDGSLTGYVNTISVNEDHFFNAPIEAFECDSDLTAKTSPYDYVTTVVYPGCVAETEVARKCPTLPWGSDCGGPHCYGVPMYRQWLTREENESTDTVIKNPTIRLAGQGNFQRSTLSVNHGKYYIDTAVSEATQRAQPRVSSLNVFKENQTYYVFLVFAKATTRQTYQLFVGTHGFDEKSTGSLRMVRADVHTNAYTFKYPAWHDSPSPNPWKRSYDPTTGILEVTIDLTDFAQDFADARKNRCRPVNFCAWDTSASQCKCALKPGDYLFEECMEDDSAVCSWAVKDLECPNGGCFGFAVTLPATFASDLAGLGKDPRLNVPATCFPKDANWNVSFVDAASEGLAGKQPRCYKAPVEPPQFCE